MTIPKESLLAAVQAASMASGRDGNISCADGMVYQQGVGIACGGTVDLGGPWETGAQRFAAALSKCDSNIQIDVGDTCLRIASGPIKAQLAITPNVTRMAGLPEMRWGGWQAPIPQELHALVDCIFPDESRTEIQILQCVIRDGVCTMAASDGRIVALLRFEAVSPDMAFNLPKLSATAIASLASNGSPWRVGMAGEMVVWEYRCGLFVRSVQIQNAANILKTMEPVAYPGDSKPPTAVIMGDVFKDAVSAVAWATNKISDTVKLQFSKEDQSVTLSMRALAGDNMSVGNAETSFAAEIADDRTFFMGYRYLHQIASSCGNSVVRATISDDTFDPTIWRIGDLTYIVAPRRGE